MAKKSSETPLMKQYYAIKAKYPGTILLFRVGDFYETFSDDAVKVAEILGIVLTKRANGAASHVELAGFPHHSLDSYLPKLVRAGQRVAVCDQLEDPKQAKGIVKRGVTEHVTPGVAISDKILNADENNYLAAVWFENARQIGAAFIEVSTGDFFCLSGDADYIEKVTGSLKPAEVLVPRKDMRVFREHFGEKFYLTRLEDWVFQDEYSRECLLKHFEVKNLKGFGIEKDPAGIVAAGAIIHYLNENKHGDLRHIHRIYRFDDSEYVWLDHFTIRNLELIRSNHPDGKALIDILDQTHTPMGARMLRKLMLFPLKNPAKIAARQGIVEAMIKSPELSEKVVKQMQQLGDLERLVSKLAARKLMPREAVLLRESLKLIPQILESLKAFECSYLEQKIAAFEDTNPAYEVLKRYLYEEVINQVGQGGVIAEGISEELDELRKLSSNGKDLLLEMQQREVERTGISSLKIGFNKVFGYYLEVTNAHKDKVPDDFIRKQTLTNCERYITEELKQYEEKILNAEEKIGAVEVRFYELMLNELQHFLQAIQTNANLLAEVDVYSSFAETAKARGFVKPEINTGNIIDIKAGRHPVIEASLPRDEAFIPNDVYLDDENQQIIIITGPNMAGKSALLRQTAIIVLMAQLGSFVPADEAKIGIVDKIFVRVGASDNISSGESTFMVEMNETARILNNATPKSLILLDEIGRGTSTYDGVSIAWALVEYLHEEEERAARTLFATHYHELNEITKKFSRVKNFNVSVKEIDGRIIFMRKLVPGGSEHSFGIHVAEMAGMPKNIVKRSNELLTHFEQNKVADKETAANIKFSSKQQIQLNMFELKDADTLKIRNILSGCDIDRMTPVEALLKLQEIKRVLLEEEQAESR